MDWHLIVTGFGASILVSLATGAGAVPVLFVRRVSDRLRDTLLGFAAGVMLAASFFSLIIPAIAHAQAQGAARTPAAVIVTAAVLLGGIVLAFLNRRLPHEHFVLGRSGATSTSLRRVWLFVIAITLHNFPEGMAVGVGFGSGDLANAITLAIGIGLQNFPEGLAVALALVVHRYTRRDAIMIATATGMVEPLGGLLGVTAVTVFAPLLPWGMGFAAGAMIFVISNEIVPETHRAGHENAATSGLMAGLGAMMVLDVAFS
jgi:ZIP family zinc transporter